MIARSPSVSVVVPVYATERYVKSTIESVLAQTLKDFEIVVVDDGSPDGSIERCREIDDPRIHYVHQENAGLAAARNAGLRASSGRYIAFLDSDDLWDPEKLARHVEHLEANRELGMSYSFSALIDGEGAPLGTFQMLGREDTSAVDCFVRNPIGNGSNAVLRAEVLRGEGLETPAGGPQDCLFDEQLRHAEDYELWVRIAKLTPWRIGCVPWPLTRYRLHASGLSSNVDRQYAYHMQAIDKIATYAPRLVERHRAVAESTLHWYLARILLLQRQVAATRREVVRGLRCSPTNLRSRFLLLMASLALMAIIPEAAHERLSRRALRLYGRLQSLGIRRRQRALSGAADR